MDIFNFKRIKELLKKIKTVKNIEIIVGVIIIVISIMIYIGVSNKRENIDTEINETSNTNVVNSTDLETRLANILREIEGAGDVKVMITYNGSPEIITANTTNTHNNSTISNGSETTSSTQTISPIVVNSNGKSQLIIIKEIMPDIKGVIVVAKGASNIKVRLELLRAVQAILDLNANMIEVFTMK
ncbi:MAG: hypothetical protein LBF68_05770 [Christensenellaceae bacterium]|jgi:stage III sporulation protein AG|nr:hypothetical protein [Christensenellaceae bacterium]